MALTEAQAEPLDDVLADGFVNDGDVVRKTYGRRWTAALSLANSGSSFPAVSQLYDGLKAHSETGSPDGVSGLRAVASQAFDLVAGDNVYARGLLTEEFEHCISLMDKVRPCGDATTLSLGAVLQERITEAAMLIAQLVAMLRLHVPVSPETYGDACVISVLGVFMHDSLASLRTGWTQVNKTLEHYSDVDSRAAALFSMVCAYLVADSTRDRMGGTALDLVRAHLTSNVCESRYGIGEEVLALAGGDSVPGYSPVLDKDFLELEKAVLETVRMRGATPTRRVIKAISHAPEACSAIMRLGTSSFKADAANFTRLCLPTLYSSLMLDGHSDTDLTAFTLYYVTCVIPPWVPEERLSAVVTIHRILYGLEGNEPEGVTTEQDALAPISGAYEAIDRLGPTGPGELDLRELCRAEFTRCWELRRHREAAWRHTRPKNHGTTDGTDVYFRMRRCEGLWELSDRLSAAAQGVSTYTDVPAAAARATIHAFESLAAGRRAKQDHGRLLHVDLEGDVDVAAEAALGLYALPDLDYGIGASKVRSAQLTVMASVFGPLLTVPGHLLWRLLSKRQREPMLSMG